MLVQEMMLTTEDGDLIKAKRDAVTLFLSNEELPFQAESVSSPRRDILARWVHGRGPSPLRLRAAWLLWEGGDEAYQAEGAEGAYEVAIGLDWEDGEAETAAEHLMRRAAEAGVARAAGWLAMHAAAKDDPEAVRIWNERAAAGGFAPAMVDLAKLLLSEDRGVEAVDWLKRAARTGDKATVWTASRLLLRTQGKVLVGIIRGIGGRFWCVSVPPPAKCDEGEFRKARVLAMAGSAEAALRAGIILLWRGEMVEAREFLEAAAAGGVTEGKFLFGVNMLEDDREVGLDWVAQAANEGHVQAQGTMATMYWVEGKHDAAEREVDRLVKVTDMLALTSIHQMLKTHGADPLAWRVLGAIFSSVNAGVERGDRVHAQVYLALNKEAGGGDPVLLEKARRILSQARH